MTAITTRTTLASIREMLRADGYDDLVTTRAADIKRAARGGALLWSAHRLTTTDASRIDERPR